MAYIRFYSIKNSNSAHLYIYWTSTNNTDNILFFSWETLYYNLVSAYVQLPIGFPPVGFLLEQESAVWVELDSLGVKSTNDFESLRKYESAQILKLFWFAF